MEHGKNEGYISGSRAFCKVLLNLLQVMLRVKESEVQYLKQEINSLKDELHAAQRVCLLC